jgi:hypothetical protein
MIIISVCDLSERQENYAKIRGKWFKRANCFPLSQYDVAIKECQLNLESNTNILCVVVKDASEISLWFEMQEIPKFEAKPEQFNLKKEDSGIPNFVSKRKYRGNIY